MEIAGSKNSCAMPEKFPKSSSGGRRRLLQALFLLGAMAVVTVLAYRSPAGRELGVHCLGKLGPGSVPILRRALWDESFDVQAAARDELIRLADKAVPPLVKSLSDSDTRTRIQSLNALAVVGPSGRGAVPAVAALLNDTNLEVRIQSLTALGAIGANDPAAAAAVVRAMSDTDASVRMFAAKTLGDIRAGNDIAFPALNKALNDPEPDVRFSAIMVFGKLKLRTPEAVSALEQVSAGDVSPKVREEANEVLARLNPQRKSTAPGKDAPRANLAFSGELTEAEVAVHVGKISVATLRRYLTAFGTVDPEPGTAKLAPASAKITTPLAGVVAEVNCAEGQQVEKGQVLFTLDGRKLDARIARARAVLAVAETNLSEQEKIAKPDSTAQLLFARAREARDLARSELDFALAQQALLKVTAPLSGTVVFVNVRPGEVADPESPAALVEVVDLNRLMASTSVPAADLAAVKAGQAAEMFPSPNADGVQNVITGQVTFVEDRVDPRTDMGTVDVSVPASAHLRCGQFVRVRIVTEEHRDCLAVPSESLVKNDGGEWVICLVRGKLAAQQPVAPGLRDAGWVEVQSPAIKAGDSVVTTGAAALPQKTVIRILKD
jgi:membrane fusion protein (multidrug efflux system)